MICQFNVSRMLFPFDDSRFDSFRALLAAAHSSAEATEGFISRLSGVETTAGYLAPYHDDPLTMGNLSMWESRHQLKDYVFKDPVHRELMQRRDEWFMPYASPSLVLWIRDTLDAPMTLRTAKMKLADLRMLGPTIEAFDWKFEL